MSAIIMCKVLGLFTSLEIEENPVNNLILIEKHLPYQYLII